VQSTINFFVAGPSNDSEEAQKLRDRARRSIYEMATHECDLLREVLAKDCRMESVNTNINRQFGPHQSEGFNVSGSMSFQITLK
jgi:predicted dehydrogenase